MKPEVKRAKSKKLSVEAAVALYEQDVPRGYITTECIIWCACGNWTRDSTRSRSTMAKVVRAQGWKWSRARGWMCPSCAKGEGR